MSDQPQDPKALEGEAPPQDPGPDPSADPGAGADQGKRLYRSTSDRVLGGVCGGLGEYFDIDPVLFRIGWAVFALMGGVGAVAYLAAYLIMPENDGSSVGAGERLSRVGRSRHLSLALGVVLILLGFNFLINEFDLYIFPLHRLDLDFEFMTALLFIGLGAYLVVRKSSGKQSDEKSGAAAASDASGRKFTRSRTDRRIAGICGGLASYFKLDPTLVRVAFVILALGTHLLVALIYAIMVAVVPEEEVTEAEEAQPSP